MKDYKNLNVYLSNLAVLNVNLHNIHWNVVGKQFFRVHEFTEGLYDEFFEQFDAVAELLKMKGQNPLVRMTDYAANATIKELDKEKFSCRESLDLVLEYLTEMRTLATNIRNQADGDGDFEVVAMFEDYVADYSKNIWFMKAMLDE